jgi:hypothetical protein
MIVSYVNYWLRLYLLEYATQSWPSIQSCLTLYILCIFATSPRATVVAVSTPIHTTDNGNLTFALTATNAGDIYMHLSAPATHQWVVVGTESEMDGSVMFILYEDADKTSQYPFCYFATRNIYLTKASVTVLISR